MPSVTEEEDSAKVVWGCASVTADVNWKGGCWSVSKGVCVRIEGLVSLYQ